MLPPPEQMHPRVREIVQYWRSIHRPEGGSPAAVEPAAGGRTMSAARKGGYLDELHGGPLPPRMMEGFVRVIERHEPDWYRGEPLTAHTRWVETIERVALPLAADGATVDSILNLTIYGRQGR